MTPPNSCEDCHACCLFCAFPPAATVEDFEAIPQDLRDEIRVEYERTRAIDGPCFWLNQESGICRHYEHRPPICRDFEIGGDYCLRLIERAG